MSEQTGHNNYVIATSFNFEVFNAIEKGMKETGAKSRAEYIRNILTLWHDDKGVADVARELVSVKEQRDENLQACKSHVIEFLSIQELLGIGRGMACPERIVAKIKELMAENESLTNVVCEVKSKWRGKAEDAEDTIDALTKERDVQTSLYVEDMHSICKALGYTEWAFATEKDRLANRINESIRKLRIYDTKLTQIAEVLGARISDDDLSNKVSDLKTNLENSAVSAKKDEASIEHLEKIRQTFMKAFHIKDGDNIERAGETVEQDRFLLKEREHELDFFMNREPIYKIAWRRLVQFFTKKEK